MKKFINFFFVLLMMISLIGCQSTVVDQEQVIAERLPVDFNLVLEEAYRNSEEAYSAGREVHFKRKYVLEHNIFYNEDEDVFYIKIIMSNDAIDDRLSDFEKGLDIKVSTFRQWYKFALDDALSELGNNEKIIIEIYDESDNKISESKMF